MPSALWCLPSISDDAFRGRKTVPAVPEGLFAGDDGLPRGFETLLPIATTMLSARHAVGFRRQCI